MIIFFFFFFSPQGSGIRTLDDDYFGSRGSLSLAQANDCSGEDDENENNNNLAGSRTSLGSNGLKRWTTEENLSSMEGSREGKMDLLDGPIHDSHSNSTGTIRDLVVVVVVTYEQPIRSQIPQAIE